MNSLTYQKTVNATYLAGIAGIITMPDIVFGLLLESAHLLFEIIESALDHMVEHFFHTETRETQIIVFYLMMTMAFGCLYYLSWTMSRFFRMLRENLFSTILQHKTRLLLYWAESVSNKFKLIALFNVCLTVVVLFGF